MARRPSKGPAASWWWIFGSLIGVPALALAALGISALRLEDVERRQRTRDQQDQIARLADAALITALERELSTARDTRPDDNGTIRFEISANQVISFPAHRTYAAPLGAPLPAEAAATISRDALLLADRAQEAAAQGSLASARTLYRQLTAVEELRPWATLQLGLLESSTTLPIALASSAARSPAGIPLAIVASSIVDAASEREVRAHTPFLNATLISLRDGRWWLELEQRRAYDAMLRELLDSGGVATTEDPRLAQMTSLASVVTTSFEANRHVPGRAEIAGPPGGEVVLVWNPPSIASSSSDRRSGVAVPRLRAEALIADALEPLARDQGFAIAFRDRRLAAWPRALRDPARPVPLETLPGWSIAFSSTVEAGTLQQRLLRYSMVVLPVAMLAFGISITAWIVRRELALRGMQSTFIAAVTHEFKSPITSIRLLIERIAGGRGTDAAAVERYGAAIAAEANRLEALVNRLLDVQQLHAGQKQYTFRPAAIDDVVHDVVERLRPH